MLLVGVATLGGGAFAMQTLRPGGERRLKLSLTPARQTAAPGQRVTFSVTVWPAARPVVLRATRLPRGVRASFRLNGGRRTGVVPSGQDGAILTLVASRRAGLGRKRIVIRATSAVRTRRRAVRLTLVPKRRRPLAIAARPARLTVLSGETGAYAVRLRGKRRRRLRLRVRGLPAGVRSSWAPKPPFGNRGRRARLLVRVRGGAPSSSKRVVIGTRRRAAVVVLNVRRGVPFRIAGHLGALLYPGRFEPLELRLTNPNHFTIRVTELSVAIRPRTSNPGCGADNYTVQQYRGPYPLTVPPGAHPLADLVGDRSVWPRIGMLNLPSNQDACKHARLTLDYRGTALR